MRRGMTFPAIEDNGTETPFAMIAEPKLRIDVPFPAKILWPNGRGHHHAKGRAVRLQRQWAQIATMDALQAQWQFQTGPGLVPVHIIVHAKPKGPLPDRDGVVAAAKSTLDGIADIIGINDRRFAAPTVEFATPRKGWFFVEIGG